MRAYGITHAATPVLDLAREPRFGRFDELYSEDPYLTAQIGLAAIQGLQGRGPLIDGQHLLACAKHFGAYGAAQGGRDYGSADLSERTIGSSA